MGCGRSSDSLHYPLPATQDLVGKSRAVTGVMLPSWRAFSLFGVAKFKRCNFVIYPVQKNVGRIMANEEEVVRAVRAVNVANVQVVDTAKMSFSEQLSLIRSTNILIGIHGAGLMFIMFAAEEVECT